MTKTKLGKKANKLAEKLIKQVRLNLGIKALTKNEKADLMADFTMIIYGGFNEVLQDGKK